MGIRNKLGTRGKLAAYIICLVLGVSALGALIHDLVDKPLWLLGLGDGRTYHEVLGHIGIGLSIAGAGLMVTLVCGYAWIRFLRQAVGVDREVKIVENNMGNMDATQAEEYFNTVKSQLNLGLGFGITTAGSICLRDRILIDERDLNYPWFTKQLILHEIAHYLTREDNSHGTRFHKKYAELVNRFLAENND